MLLIAALIGSGLARRHEGDLVQARADVRAAQDIGRAALARADQEAASAAIHRAEADSSALRASAAESRLAELRPRYAAAKAAAPDSCAPALALADSVMREQFLASLEYQMEAQSLRVALDSTSAALSRLRAAYVNLDGKATVLVGAAKPSWLSKITPKPGIGLAAGVNAAGQPQLILGVTLGWSR